MYTIEATANSDTVKIEQPDGKIGLVPAAKAIQAIQMLRSRGLHATVVTRYEDRNVLADMRQDVVKAACEAAGLGALAAAKAQANGKIEF